MADAEHPYCQCLFFSSNALARIITRLAEDTFQSTGLAPSLAFVLMAVERQPDTQPSDIAALMMLSPSTVTRFVEKLEAKGLLSRESRGKGVHIRLTAQGEALCPQLRAAWQETSARTVACLGSESAGQLTNLTYTAARTLDEL